MTSSKRASASDISAVDVEKVEFSPMEKHKVDEEDNVYIEGEESEESEEGEEGEESEEGEEGEEGEGSGVNKGLEGIEEPEWDVDSFDGLEWESNPEFRDSFSDDEAYKLWRAGRMKAIQDKGFLPDLWNHIGPITDLDEPGIRNMTNREYLASITSLCVNKLNEDKGQTVEFVSIVRGNLSGGSRWKLYITFMAREYPNGPLVEYQAKAMDFNDNYGRPPSPILCRPASPPTI